MLPTPPATPYQKQSLVDRSQDPPQQQWTRAPPAAGSMASSSSVPSLPRTKPLHAAAMAANTDSAADSAGSSRPLSDNELSYFLPSRADGVNDMYVHHGVLASASLLSGPRVRTAWALQLVRHPLLASRVEMKAYDYDNVSFVHTRPQSVREALAASDARLSYYAMPRAGPPDMVDAYLNGTRRLSNERLGYLVVRAGTIRNSDQSGDAGPPPLTPEQGGDLHPFEVMLCTTHYVGDGMALHTFMNEFYTLLGSAASDEDLMDELTAAVAANVAAAAGHSPTASLPPPLEDRLSLPAFSATAGRVAQRNADAALLGGQSLPVRKGRTRRTIVPTRAYTPEQTKRALGACKAHGVTIANAVFALCAVAWARRTGIDAKQPSMIYSALNMRPFMRPTPCPSFFHLAVGYFNVVLPSVIPRELSTAELVWYRALQTRKQTLSAARSPLAAATFRGTAADRAARSRHWARIDDEAATNPGLGLGIVIPHRELPAPHGVSASPPPQPAGKALLGVSMLGNLDGMYEHARYPGIRMFSLTTGSRQRAGALLLFAYTLAGKLWLSLGYDRNGFEDEAIPWWWADVLGLVNDVLLA